MTLHNMHHVGDDIPPTRFLRSLTILPCAMLSISLTAVKYFILFSLLLFVDDVFIIVDILVHVNLLIF